MTNLMTMTLGERGDPSVRLTEGDLESVVREAMERLSSGLQAAGCTVELTIDGGLPDVRFDRESLEQILSNLLDNAERYSREATDRLITVRLTAAEGGGVQLSVDDAGSGVPRRERSRIFRPFLRVGAPNAPSGLGLGLALARNLARAHQGDLTCHESPRGGASLRLTLPSQKSDGVRPGP